MTFNVSIIDDNVLEDNEEFILFIKNESLPDNVFINSSGRATVIIRNDDGKLTMKQAHSNRYSRHNTNLTTLLCQVIMHKF